VLYDPAAQVEQIRVGGGVRFEDSMRIEGTEAVPLNSNAKEYAKAINKMPEAERPALVGTFCWTEGEKQPWLERLESKVEGTWSGQFQSHASETHWEDLGAEVHVDVLIHEGTKGPDDHLSISVFKVPESINLGVGVVESGRGGARDNSMVLGSSDIESRPDDLLADREVVFTAGSETLSAASREHLRSLAARFKAGTRSPPVLRWAVQGEEVVAAEGIEAHTAEQVAEARFEAIRGALVAEGMEASRIRFQFGGVGHGSKLTVGASRGQSVAAHEFGHAFGLGDEYAINTGDSMKGTGASAGTASPHDGLARSVGLPGSIHENNDGMMSVGNALKPQDGSTFLWALRKVTTKDWAPGPARTVTPPVPAQRDREGDSGGAP